MKLTRSRRAILVIGFTAVLPWAGHAESLAVRNCTWCHGVSAHGYSPAPGLAGQRREYIQNQLKDFSEHTRDNPFSRLYMWGATANLSPATAHGLAFYFSTLSPQAANDGNRELEAEGRSIYQLGMPDSNTAACVVCHGPNAEGVGEIPRLGGLAYTYLKRRLEQWGEGYHAAARPPMPRIASKLSANQIEALASYLSFVK
jgi:cytochrome c553